MRNQSKIKDITGCEFGRLTVVAYAGNSMWNCRCLCGNLKTIKGYSLKNGDSKSCGCLSKERIIEKHQEKRDSRIGKKVGRLTVESIGVVGPVTTTYNCVCECGNKTIVSNSNLWSTNPTLSCGCLTLEVSNQRNQNYRDSMIGRRFGKLVVKSFESCIERISKYTCVCDCGVETSVIGTNLSTGNTTSCGCYARQVLHERVVTHGLSHHRLYSIWNGMIQRCTNENTNFYHHYGEKGISVCDEWRYNFQNFYNWAITNGYDDHLTIERNNNDLGYCPTNCRWITSDLQSRNRNTVKLSFSQAEKIRNDDRRQIEIAKEYGICQPTVSSIKLNKIWKPQ